MSNIVKWYESPEAFHDYCSNPRVSMSHSAGNPLNVTDIFAGMNYKGALKALLYGDVERARLAMKLFDDVVAVQTETLGRNVILPSMVGYMPNVPAVLAGLPETMLSRQQTVQMGSNAPVRVVVDLFADWRITQQQFIRRGVAAIAFVMIMNTIRPIDLYVAHTGKSSRNYGTSVAHIVKVDTKPLDLPRAVWMISDPAFFRRLGFCAIMHEAYPTTNYTEDCIPEAGRGREWLGLEKEDIYIERLLFGDVLAVTDPMKWVNNMIKQHIENAEIIKQAEEIRY